MVEDNPEEFVHILTSQGFWHNHALGRSVLGTRENVSRFSASTIKAFFKRFYHPRKIVIAAAGNLTHEALVDMVAPRFESIRAGQPIPERMAPQTFKGLKVEHRHLEQVHLCLGTSGLAATDPRRYANSLMNTILGGNMSSRLFQEIRESRGLAYAVYSYITSHQDAGMFGAYAGVDPAHVSVTTQLILEAMDGLKTQKVSASELQAAQEFIKGNLLLAAESNDNQMVRLAQNEIYYNDYLPLKVVVERIDAVTPDDIIELANELFHTEKLYLTALGPLDDQSAFTPEVMKMVA
jgi:predicted Zn-dependent peptidase